jgi:hypothetical protein
MVTRKSEICQYKIMARVGPETSVNMATEGGTVGTSSAAASSTKLVIIGVVSVISFVVVASLVIGLSVGLTRIKGMFINIYLI